MLTPGGSDTMLRRTLSLVAIAVAVTGAAPAAPPPADPAPDVIGLGEDRDRRMTVPVSIAGAGPFDFIVDTGSERTVLSEELARQLGINPTGVAEVHSVSGVGSVNTVAVADLSVSRTSARDLVAPLLKERHLGARGILGIDSLQKHSVLLDFREQTMTVTQSKRRISQSIDSGDGDTIVVTARNRLGRLILADATVNGSTVAVVIDTGAEHSIGNAALKRRVLRRNGDSFVVPTTIYSVTGGSVPAEVTLVKTMRLGSLTLTQMPVAFADVAIFRQLGLERRPAMLLGMNTLRAFDRVAVDFANRKVTFVVPGESRLDEGERFAALR
jgi:predicted aspartyl protease